MTRASKVLAATVSPTVGMAFLRYVKGRRCKADLIGMPHITVVEDVTPPALLPSAVGREVSFRIALPLQGEGRKGLLATSLGGRQVFILLRRAV